jgi:hypothetical protein
MGDTTRGLYGKYRVERTDGKSAPGEKHYGCQYFVLDLDHDPHARAALAAYRDSCKAEYPRLAADLHALLYGCEFGGTPTAELGRPADQPPAVPQPDAALVHRVCAAIRGDGRCDQCPTDETPPYAVHGGWCHEIAKRAILAVRAAAQPSVCHVTWGSNPLQDVLDAFTRLYPELAVTVHIAPTEAGLGFTEFPDDGSTPSICVDPGLPYSGVMDILAHELAHVAAGSAEDHGPVWQAAYDAIRDDYEREVTSRGETVAYSPEGGRASDPTSPPPEATT